MVPGHSQTSRAGLVNQTRLEIRMTIGCRDSRGAIESHPSEIELPPNPNTQPLNPVVSRETPARWPRLELPWWGGQFTDPARQLFHLTLRDERVGGGPKGWRQHRTGQQRRRVGRNVHAKREAVAVAALARYALGLLPRVTRGARD